MRLQVHGRQAGFSLITASIVLTVAALIMVSMLPGQKAGDTNRKYADTEKKLERVEEAMRGFMASTGRLPCPADATLAPNTANFGAEMTPPGTCNSGTLMGPDALTNEIVSGMIPTRTLGLSDDYSLDGWGRRIDYVVDLRSTSHGTCPGLTTGGLTIVNTTQSGSTTIDKTMYAFVSHGPDGHGAFPMQGGPIGSRINTGSLDKDKDTNAGVSSDGTFTYNTNNFLATRVQKAPTPTFKDLVWYRPDLKNSCCLGASCSAGGGGTTCTLNGNQQPPGTLPGSAPGNTATEYQNSADSSCTPETMTCNSGTLSCSSGNMQTDCRFATCHTVPPACYTASTAGPLDSTFTPTSLNGSSPGNTAPAFQAANDPICTANTLTCTSGSLSCTCGGVPCAIANCNYSSCVKQCSLPWGGTINGQAPGNTTTAYNATTVAYPTICSSTTLTCTNGSLSGTSGYIYPSCTETGQPCTLSANQGGGQLSDGNSMNAYKNSSDSTCTAATLTCTNKVLSCSTGNMSDCTYSTCTLTSGSGSYINLWVVDDSNNRVQEFNSSGTYLSQFGNPPPANGTFFGPDDAAIDSGGNIWVADGNNNRVEEFSVSGPTVWVVDSRNSRVQEFSSSGAYISQFGSNGSGNGQFSSPNYTAIDSGGNIWVADNANNRVEKLNTGGTMLLTFGTSGSGNGQFSGPSGITIDGSGNVWVADKGNNRVEEFSSSGTWLSKLGSSGTGNSQFNGPIDIAADSGGNLWVTDSGNYRVEEFSISTGKYVSQFGGSPCGAGNGQFSCGSAGGPGPHGIAADASGNIWAVDTGNYRVEKWSSSGTWLKNVGSYGFADGQLDYPSGIAIDGSGNLWVTDNGNNRVQEFNSSGTWLLTFPSGCPNDAAPACYSNTVNGQFSAPIGIAVTGGGSWTFKMGIGSGYNGVSGNVGDAGNGNGQFHDPTGIAVDQNGNIWVAEYDNNRLQEFSSSGNFLLKFGSFGSGNSQFFSPYGVVSDSSGNIYVADEGNSRVQKFSGSGTWLAQIGSSGSGNGQVANPLYLAFDGSGNLWVADKGNNRVEEFSSSGTYLSKFSASTVGITIDGSGNVWGTDGYSVVSEWNSTGTLLKNVASGGTGNGQVNVPQGIFADSSNNIWVADENNNRMEEFNSGGAYVSQFGSNSFLANGKLQNPYGIAIDGGSNFWVTDAANQRVQEFSSSGTFLTALGSGYNGVAGNIGTTGSGNGQFHSPEGIAIDKSGNVLVVDDLNARVEKFSTSGTYLGKFGVSGFSSGDFQCPNGVVADSGNNYWVTDFCNDSLLEFNSSGTFLKQYTTTAAACGSSGILENMAGIAVDSSGNFWIADNINVSNTGWLDALSSADACVDHSTGGGGHSFYGTTHGTAIDSTGNVWVTDSFYVWEFSSSGTYLGKFGTGIIDSANGDFGGYGPGFLAATGTAPSGCTLPWGGTLGSGGSIYAYGSNEVAPAGSCGSPNTLVCTNGSLVCNLAAGGSGAVGTYCEYPSCAVECNLPWGGTLNGQAPGNTIPAYEFATVAYPNTCTSQTLICNNGSLSGTFTNQSCTETGQPCQGTGALSWVTLNDTQTTTAYQNANVTAPATCQSGTITCNNGTLSDPSTYTNQSCTATCSLTANQGGGTLPIVGPGNTKTEYTSATETPSCTAETMTCSSTGLSCSTGNMSDCSYANCSTGPSYEKLPGANCGAGGEVGYSVAVGDVNGDGYPDLVIGAPDAGSFAGKVLVIYGTSSGIPALNPCTALTGANGFELDGATASDEAGISVAVADVNGDGYADIIIGASAASYNGLGSSGSVYVVYGGPTGKKEDGTAWAATNALTSGGSVINGTNGSRFDGDAGFNFTGQSVAAGWIKGTVNGLNKVYDIIIGAPRVINNGAAYVVYGSTSAWAATNSLTISSGTIIDGTHGFRLDGVTNSDFTGGSVASGDVNNDGKDDIIIGSQSAGYSASTSGSVYVVFGGSTMKSGAAWSKNNSLTSTSGTVINGTNGYRLDGGHSGDEVGYSVATGDFNGDGKKDIIMGAYLAGYTGIQTGSTYVVYGGSSVLPSTTVNTTHNKPCGVVASAAELQVGQTVVSANIPSGTTITAIGAACGSGTCSGATCITFSANDSSTASGTAMSLSTSRLTSGSGLIDGTHGLRFDAPTGNELSGYAVGTGDINGDGSADLIIGAYNASYGASTSGSVYVVYGGTTRKGGLAWGATNTLATGGGSLINGFDGFRLDDPTASDSFGNAIATGDFNKDGYYDMAIGAYNNGSGAGLVYIAPGNGGYTATNTLP